MGKLFTVATIIAILLISQVTVSSCTKTDTVTDTVTKTVTDTVTKLLVDNSVSHFLLGKQWIVDSLYENYTASTPGTLVYLRGGSNNTQNLDNFAVILWPDGSQFFFHNGVYDTYTYSFQSSDSLQLLINNPQPDYARIVTLNANYLTIYDSTNSALSFYVYKP